MPCSVRSTSAPRLRRVPSLPMSPPRIAAVFDLTSEVEREVRALIERLHRGRWPLFRCYAMRRVGSVVYEVARWNPTRPGSRPPTYSLVTWDLSAIGLRWRDYPTLDDARTAFAVLIRNIAAGTPAAPAAACAAP
jgi:hypothetical protein